MEGIMGLGLSLLGVAVFVLALWVADLNSRLRKCEWWNRSMEERKADKVDFPIYSYIEDDEAA